MRDLNDEGVAINPGGLVDPATVGQCTGLRDCNGDLIYEGDLLGWTPVVPDWQNTTAGAGFPVIWDGGTWCADIGFMLLPLCDDDLLGDDRIEVSIVGNIYDEMEDQPEAHTP